MSKKLYLNVAESVPALPKGAREETNLVIRTLKKLSSRTQSQTLAAYLLDAVFFKQNVELLKKHPLPEGSVVFWNPNGDRLEDLHIPQELVYEEITSYQPANHLLRCLRHLYHKLHLEYELKLKDEALQAGDRLNKELLQVGVALSAERDNDALLDLILRTIRRFTNSDAGSLYLLNEDAETGEKSLLFKIAQNDSNPADFTEFSMPLNKKSIGGYVVSTGEILNLRDVYQIPENREYSFNKSYDQQTGYRTMSMLTVPMKDHKDEIIGAVQLINRKKREYCQVCTPEDVKKYVLSYSKQHESLAMSLASQAAVSLENNLLYQEIERLFEGFVQASVTAIESRDPTTSGHSSRVAVYTVNLARAVERMQTGSYSGIVFSSEQVKEIRYASLLHDFGKVGVREHVLVKADKLYPDQLELIKMRFAYMQTAVELAAMQERFDLLLSKGEQGYKDRKKELDQNLKSRLAELNTYIETVISANVPTVLDREPERILDKISKQTYLDVTGREVPMLSEDEYIKLRVKRGSLDEQERTEIESHVTHTYLFLKTIPWTKSMQKIPMIAYGHHEKLDGIGYPRGLKSEEIPIQTRMMTISDIFDALTASDRPYKKAVTTTRALDILNEEVEGKHVDRELLDLFVKARVFEVKDKLIRETRKSKPLS